MTPLHVGTRRCLRGGSMFFFFAVVALPMLLLAGAVAIDIGRLIVAHRQLETSLSAATLAGAWTFDQSGAANRGLDTADALANAYATYCQSVADVMTAATPAEGVSPGSAAACADPNVARPGGIRGDSLGADISISNTAVDGQQQVVADGAARVNDLILLGFARALLSGGGDTSITIRAQSVAYTCNADTTSDQQDGHCSRPLPVDVGDPA